MIIKINPDKERARAIMKMALNREQSLGAIKKAGYSTIICEFYYEIIKELMGAILYLEGKKSVGVNAHKDLIEEISKMNVLPSQEISLVDDLRIKRNGSSYYGKQIENVYLENKEFYFKRIILNLRKYLEGRLNG